MAIVRSALMALALAACRPAPVDEVPEFVYLRTESVVVTVEVHAAERVQVGEWLTLRASRSTTGPWRQVRFKDVAQDTPWIGYVPPEREEEVAASLRWFVEPAEGVAFDAWAPTPVPVRERAVRFSQPGTYRLWATSHAPVDATSNALQVTVVPK
jgi:hypothetical protein